MRIGSVYWSAGPSQSAPYGAASSPKGRAKVASLRRNDAAKLQFSEMLSQTDMHIRYCLIAEKTGYLISHIFSVVLLFQLPPTDFHGFSQFCKPSRLAAGDEHLAGDDLVQDEILPSGIQLAEDIVQ